MDMMTQNREMKTASICASLASRVTMQDLFSIAPIQELADSQEAITVAKGVNLRVLIYELLQLVNARDDSLESVLILSARALGVAIAEHLGTEETSLGEEFLQATVKFMQDNLGEE